jgi:RNA polymerase sigma-70 factor (sigma-E family)
VRTASLVTGDAGHAEDLVQSALVRVYSSWSRVGAAQDMDAYVMRILLNTNKNRFRKRRVAEHLTTEFPDSGAMDSSSQFAERSALFSALMALPVRQRSVVVLRYWEDFGEKQVAAILGCSVGTVKSQASKGLAKLRADVELAALIREADSTEGVL